MLRSVRQSQGFLFLSCLLLYVLITLPALHAQEQGQPKDQRRPRRISVPQQPQSKPSEPTERPNPDRETSDEVVRIDTDLTNVLFTAIDKERRFVTTLTKEDVQVLENGVPQQLFTFERETDLPLSLAVLIDTSKSQERTLPDEKSAAQGFLDAILRPDRDRAAIISFTGEATLEQGLTGKRESLRTAIERVQIVLPPENTTPLDVTNDPRGWTGIWDAIWVTAQDVMSQARPSTRRAIILLSDGDDTSSIKKRDEAIAEAIKSETVVYAIGIGDRENYDVNEGALKKLAERTGGRAFFPRNETELRAAFYQIQAELRSQYLIAYSPSNRSRDGVFRRISIEIINPQLRKQKLRLLYRQGYYARGQ
jgi:VWFA-related protein